MGTKSCIGPNTSGYKHWLCNTHCNVKSTNWRIHVESTYRTISPIFRFPGPSCAIRSHYACCASISTMNWWWTREICVHINTSILVCCIILESCKLVSAVSGFEFYIGGILPESREVKMFPNKGKKTNLTPHSEWPRWFLDVGIYSGVNDRVQNWQPLVVLHKFWQ